MRAAAAIAAALWGRLRESARADDLARRPLLPPMKLERIPGLKWGGRPVYRLLEDYQFGRAYGSTAVVPADFRTDLASVPWWIRWLFPPNGPWERAAAVHDYLYSRAAQCPRFLADAILRDMMAAAGVARWARLVIFYAVRLAGGRYFRVR